jgi:flavorubredoxin
MNIFIVYDSKYGNTKLAAEKILEGIKETEIFEVAISNIKDIDPQKLADYDVIIIGSPNHMGAPSRAMKKFVDKLPKYNLKAKYVAVFGTYAGKERPIDRAVKKMEQMIKEKLPKTDILLPPLSIRVNGIPGPIADGELPKCMIFGQKIANQLKT